MPIQERPVFLLECLWAVMFALLANVFFHFPELRLADPERRVTSLPAESALTGKVLFDPSRRPAFDTLESLAQLPANHRYAMEAGCRAARMPSRFWLDTRLGGCIMAATMVRTEPEHQRGHGNPWTGNPGKQQFDHKHKPVHKTLRKFAVAWPLVVFLLLPASLRAETTVQAWVQRYNGPGNADDYANALAVDRDNNVIVTGHSTGSGSGWDYATIKYSSAGVPLWTNSYTGPENATDEALAVAVDGSNNVFVTGYLWCSESDYDYATIQYSSAGVPLWTNHYNGPANGNDYASAIAVDGDYNVIVTGSSYGGGGDYDYATIKYSSAGVPLWTNCYNGPGNVTDEALAVAVDGSNNVIVTGYSYGGGSYYDYATIKYSSAGVPLWTNCYTGPGNNYDEAYAVAVDGSNNVIVTGGAVGSGGNYDYATIQYSSAGVPLWTNLYNGPANGNDHASGVAVDSNNNMIVTGWSRSSGSYPDYATIKYSSAGVPLWTNRYNGPGSYYDTASAVAVDGSNNVIVTGQSLGTGGNYDLATVKYVSVGPMPLMTALQMTNGSFQMRVDEVLQTGTLVIEASTNLSAWSPVFTNTTSTNVVFYTDPEAGNHLGRFYRAVQFP